MGKEPCPREHLIEPCLQEVQENALGVFEEQPEASAVGGG